MRATSVGYRVRIASALVSLLSVGCAASTPAPLRPALPSRWSYEVRVDVPHGRLHATVCFEPGPLPQLVLGRPDAERHLIAIERVDETPDRSTASQCVAYTIDLFADRFVSHHGGSILASPIAWLVRPARMAVDARATLRFADDGVAVPWPREGDHVVLTAGDFQVDSQTAFGVQRLAQAPSEMRAYLADGALALTRAEVDELLQLGLETTRTLSGTLPFPEVQVLVVPVAAADDPSNPIPFGVATRSGPAAVTLFVSANADATNVDSDWVLPHELAHFFLPRLADEDAYVSEGFATYLQEILRARAGRIQAADAWRHLRLEIMAARNEGHGTPLAQASGSMHETRAYRPVYWAGAAFFLAADVALRERSGGRVSLDTLVAELARDPDLRRRATTRAALFARLDAMSRTDVFSSLARRAETTSFPEVDPVFDALGVHLENGTVAFDDRAPLAPIREEITEHR